MKRFFCRGLFVVLGTVSAAENFFPDRKTNFTPLHQAVWDKNAFQVSELARELRAECAQTPFGHTPLHVASFTCTDPESDMGMLMVLLSATYNSRPCIYKDAQDEAGRTALHFAVLTANRSAVRVLLHHAVATDLQDREGKTALERAQEYSLREPESVERKEILKLMKEGVMTLANAFSVPVSESHLVREARELRVEDMLHAAALEMEAGRVRSSSGEKREVLFRGVPVPSTFL